MRFRRKGADKIYNTYENGGDVWKATGGVVGEIAGSLATGLALGYLICTPVGWVTAIALAVGEGVAIAGFGELGERAGDFIGEGLEDLYDWSKSSLARWF